MIMENSRESMIRKIEEIRKNSQVQRQRFRYVKSLLDEAKALLELNYVYDDAQLAELLEPIIQEISAKAGCQKP